MVLKTNNEQFSMFIILISLAFKVYFRVIQYVK